MKECVENEIFLSNVVMTRWQEERIRNEMFNQLRQKNNHQPLNQLIDNKALRKIVKKWDTSFIYRAGTDNEKNGLWAIHSKF